MANTPLKRHKQNTGEIKYLVCVNLLRDLAFTKCRFLKKRQKIEKNAFSILVLDIYFAHVSPGKT